MECSYGVKDGECGHYKCEWCNECSEGSQIHRHCLPEFLRDQYGEMDADTEDTESVSLLADITECLPTEEEEAEIDAIRGNTPLSFGTEADEETERGVTAATAAAAAGPSRYLEQDTCYSMRALCFAASTVKYSCHFDPNQVLESVSQVTKM